MTVVFVSERPESRFHERFFAPHDSKADDYTMIPSSWSVDKIAHDFQQTNTLMMNQLATFETTRELNRRTSRKVNASTLVSSMKYHP